MWYNEQLSIAAVSSIDLSQFGGPVLPGSVNGHSMFLKVWDSSSNLEYNADYEVSTGNGTFNELFSAISEIYFNSLLFIFVYTAIS